MPRRHHRDARPESLGITPADIPRVRPIRTPEQREADAEAAAEKRRARFAAERRRRVSAAVNWDVCCIPGCESKAGHTWPEGRDVEERLPVCTDHAVIIKRQIDPYWDDEDVIESRRKRQAHVDQKRDARERAGIIDMNGGSARGQVYFLRLNGLVKVGWSSDLIGRLKAYGPDVVVLCHYPASRQDETLMHRQLRPYLAKGREWYQDCPLIADVVAQMVRQYGEPYLSAYWTQPKPDPIKRRKRSA